MNTYDTNSGEHRWVLAEQAFMRFIGISLLVTAIISMIFGVFPDTGEGVISTVNIVATLILGIGSLWSLWWSSSLDRLYALVDGFQENGAGRTYYAIVLQVIAGILFTTELASGRFVLGALGIIMLISAIFFFWRAQQISKYS